ncbi:MAG: Uma2 family endonuclease [Spirulinaceae cyanobacterium]
MSTISLSPKTESQNPNSPETRYYSPEEYLALEETADYKSEYINGEILTMAGGSINHNRVALNLSTELNFAFKKLDYQVFMADVRLWIPEKNSYTYPDIMVVKGEPEYYKDRSDTITNPLLIVEVLSKSTQSYDRDLKFRAYRSIPTFQEYLLFEQDEIYVEQYVKTDTKRWSLQEYDQEDKAISFAAVEGKIILADAYNKVKFTQQTSDTQK